MPQTEIFIPPIKIDFEHLLAALKMPANSEPEDLDTLRKMLEEALITARPKAVYRVVKVDAVSQDKVFIGGLPLCGSLFAKLFSHSLIAAPYVATCGLEAEEWSHHFFDPLEHYWADGIKRALLRSVRKSLKEHLAKEVFFGGDVSSVNPGSLPDWMLDGQTMIFELLGNKTREVGVTLTDSLLMLPTKSSSGIAFSAQNHFENCQLCRRENCPGRRAEPIAQTASSEI
jgi:hypothetical protein